MVAIWAAIAYFLDDLGVGWSANGGEQGCCNASSSNLNAPHKAFA